LSPGQFAAFARDVQRFRSRIISLHGALDHVRSVRSADFVFARAWLAAIRAKRALSAGHQRVQA
jgi:hypothetical protein